MLSGKKLRGHRRNLIEFEEQNEAQSLLQKKHHDEVKLIRIALVRFAVAVNFSEPVHTDDNQDQYINHFFFFLRNNLDSLVIFPNTSKSLTEIIERIRV